ncbi:hypothetical protein L1887_11485 [Cichorium endivia]|nr:hypothetical protein L1887_11485 [Cichorium endivia]
MAISIPSRNSWAKSWARKCKESNWIYTCIEVIYIKEPGYMPSDLYNLKSAYGTQRPQGIEKKTKEDEQISRSALSTFKAKEEEIEKKNLEVRKRVEAQLGRIEEETRKNKKLLYRGSRPHVRSTKPSTSLNIITTRYLIR